jgi:hypothetical protein
MKSIICAALAIVSAIPAWAGEIHPTPGMLAAARRLIPSEGKGDTIEYHFRRRFGTGAVLVCGYHMGGNGGFCGQTTLATVRKVDALAEDTCRQDSAGGVPHSITGEAIWLNYTCVRGHMKRLPYASVFDTESYPIEKWFVVPN